MKKIDNINSDNNKNNTSIEKDIINPVKAHLNLPVSLWEDLKELSILTGKSMDTLCWESLFAFTEEKLKVSRGFNKERKKRNKKKI